MKRKKIFIICVLLTISAFNASCLCSNDKISGKDFITKNNYGDFSLLLKDDYCNGKSIVVPLSKEGIIKSCSATYFKQDQSGNYESFWVRIEVFLNKDFAKNYFLFNHIRKKRMQNPEEKPWNNDHQFAQTGEFTPNENWLSNDIMIYLTFRDVNKKIKEEVISDFRRRFPPTHSFTADDLNIKFLYKKEIQLKLDLINIIDDYRDDFFDRFTFKRPDALEAQCRLEIDVRCLSGIKSNKLNFVTCNNTVMDDDSDRRESWDTLRREAGKREAVLENAIGRGSTCRNRMIKIDRFLIHNQ